MDISRNNQMFVHIFGGIICDTKHPYCSTAMELNELDCIRPFHRSTPYTNRSPYVDFLAPLYCDVHRRMNEMFS